MNPHKLTLAPSKDPATPSHRPARALPRVALFCVVLAGASLSTARSAEYTWDGGGANDNLNTADNWTGNTLPVASDILVWNGLESGVINPLVTGDIFGTTTTGLAAITVKSGQTGALNLAATSGGTRTLRMAAAGNFTIEAGAGAVTLGGANPWGFSIAGGGVSDFTFTNNSSNAATITSSVTINRGGSTGTRRLVFSGSGNWNVGSAMGASLASLSKSGSGVLTFSGTSNVSAFASGVEVSAGTLIVSGTLSNASSAVSVASGATLGGTGLINGATTILGTLSPGSSPGKLTIANDLTLGGGASLNWQIYDAEGSAGVGADLADLTSGGDLNLSLLSSSDKFNINLWSLSGIGPDANGDAVNFDNTQDYTWTLVSTGSVITGFSEDLFQINIGAANGTGGFSNSLGGGTFSVGLADGGTDLVLHFTAVPEPAAWMLTASAGLALLIFRRRPSR